MDFLGLTSLVFFELFSESFDSGIRLKSTLNPVSDFQF